MKRLLDDQQRRAAIRLADHLAGASENTKLDYEDRLQASLTSIAQSLVVIADVLATQKEQS